MKATIVVFAMLLMLSMISAPVISVAQTVPTVYVDIGGTQRSGASPLDISGAYGNVTITQYNTAAGLARVEVVGADGTQDFLVVKNARITANAPVTNYLIAFWATLGPNPSAAEQYQTRITGSLMRGTNGAQNDSVLVKGWFNNTNQIGSNLSRTITCNTPPPCGAISLSTTANETPSGNRDLKGEFWITMTLAGDVLNLPSGSASGVAVKNTAAIGDEECEKLTGEERKKCEKEEKEMQQNLKQQQNPMQQNPSSPSMR